MRAKGRVVVVGAGMAGLTAAHFLKEAGYEVVVLERDVSVFKHVHTYPQYRFGAFEKLLRFKATEGEPKGLYFAGDYTDGGLIEGAAQSGYKAAQRVMAG